MMCVFVSLPRVVKRRVNALKNLQVKCANIEAKFYEEVHELERKYAALYQPLYDKVGVCARTRSLPVHAFSSSRI